MNSNTRPKTFCTALLLVGLLASIAAGQTLPFSLFQEDTAHLGLSPAAEGGVAAALANPAAWSATDRNGAAFWWSDLDTGRRGLRDWGFSSNRFVGFAARHRSLPVPGGTAETTDWQLGFSGGGRDLMRGIALRWSTGDTEPAGRRKALLLGQIHRPNRYVSLGLSGRVSLESNDMEGVVDLALRPTGSSRFTVCADYSLLKDEDLSDGRFGAGFEIRPRPGLRLGLKFRDTGPMNDIETIFSLGFTFSGTGLHYRSAHDDDGDLSHSTYLLDIRSGAETFRGLPASNRTARIVPIDLGNKVLTYQKYKHFDKVRLPWLDLMPILDAVSKDDRIDGVALNLSNFRGRPSLVWELRRKLAGMRDAGRTVHIHIDRAGMLLYDLASVADHLSMDPQGELLLPGFEVSKTYMAGLLDKLGLGFTALQFFPHKTAVEALSRKDMSDGDREQLGRLIETLYGQVRDDVCAGRGLSPADYDRIIDEEVMISPDRALELGLVDTIERWHGMKDRLVETGGVRMTDIDRNLLRSPLDRRWGRRPGVAVVHAIGVCEMETGIRGRATGEYLRSLVRNPAVSAVVLRADSPGGDPLPSDLVAEAVTRLREAGKPVVVSQGDVAASGGYWISMNGSHVMTTPLTITGSVGVIAGWIWDREMHEKVGLSLDGLHKGKHATLFRNMRYPVGIGVPSREMTGEEYDMARERILALYDRFVEAVADGRNLEPEAVRRIAGGRVWMGGDAVGNGLCDGIGGLRDAIDKARDLAGVAEDEQIRLIEYPPRKFMEFPGFGPTLPDLGLLLSGSRTPAAAVDILPEPEESGEFTFIRAISEARGSARVITPPYLLPDAWRAGDR